MTRFIFLLILFSVGYILYHLYGKKLLKRGPKALIGPVLAILLVFILFAVATGRASAIFAVLGGLLAAAWRLAPLLLRFSPQIKQLLHKLKKQGAPSGASQSRVESTILSMTLDHASGAIDGIVKTGKYSERTLSSLNQTELKALYQQCGQDTESLRLLQAYLQREHAEEFSHQQTGNSTGNASNNISIDEALDILGLSDSATREEIVASHRQLMAKLHPDKGGSNYLATRINQAKDLLVSQLSTDK